MSSNLGGALSCFLAHDVPGLSCTCLAQLWHQLFLQASLGSLVGSYLYPLAAFSRVGNSLPLLGFWYPMPGCHHALFMSCSGSCPRLPLRCDALFTPFWASTAPTASKDAYLLNCSAWGEAAVWYLCYTCFYIKSCWSKDSWVHLGLSGRLENEAIGYQFCVPNLLKYWRNYLSFALSVYILKFKIRVYLGVFV